MEESVAVQSEISMSVVTEQWRAVQPRHPRTSMFRWPSWLRRRSSASPPPYHLLERRPVEKPSFLRKHVNSEPVIFLSCTAFGILGTVYPLFLFWARCIEMYDSFDRPKNDNSTKNATDFCMHISNMKDRRALNMVEADVAQKTIYLQLCSTLTSLITAPIFGAWSDYHGRRRPFIVCQFGSLLYGLLIFAGSFLFVGRNVYAFLAPAELCFGLFSGIMVFTLASTIVIDECRQQLAESRSGGIPTRIMVACAVQFLGFFTGNLLTSLLLSHQTSPAEHGQLYALALLLTTTFFALGLVYTQFWVRETHFPGQNGGTGIDGQQPMEPFSTHLRHYTVDAFGVLVKKRDGWVRLCLMLTVCFMFVEFMSIDSSLMFLVLKQFNWSDEQFSNLCLFRVLLNAIGIVLMPQLLRLLPCAGGESIFVMAAIVAAGLGAALFAFAHTVQEVYALSLLCLLSAGTSPGFRTILSRFVPKAETGRLFALVAMVFIFCPLVSKAIFNNFYWATMRQWPGMVFLLMGAVHVVVLIGQILVHCLMLPMWNAAAADSDSSEGSGTFSSNSSTGLSGESDRSVVGSTTGEEEE